MKYLEKMMIEGNFQGAIEGYNNVLSKHDNISAKSNLAKCYFEVKDLDNAEYWYRQLLYVDQSDPIDFLSYAFVLQYNDKCDLANKWFKKYINAFPKDLRKEHFLNNCKYVEELKTKKINNYKIEHMPFNSGLDDIRPMYYGNDIVFASETSQIPNKLSVWTGNLPLKLKVVKRNEEENYEFVQCSTYAYEAPTLFSYGSLKNYQEISSSFNENKSVIYFTRVGYLNKNNNKAKIYFAECRGEVGDISIVNLKSMPFNNNEYSIKNPILSKNGDFIYFTSDMPGGFGGMDLYVSEKEEGRWGAPINLGPKVNTEMDEDFPYLSENDRLYFSSDGQLGLGGLDVYYVDKKHGFNNWGAIVNLGRPINSNADDFGIIMNSQGTHGYFTSDREGGFGDNDIYSFCKLGDELNAFIGSQDVTYKIQLEARRIISDKHFSELSSSMAGLGVIKLEEIKEKGLIRLMLGDFDNEKDAICVRDEVKRRGYDRAYIVEYENEERVAIRVFSNKESSDFKEPCSFKNTFNHSERINLSLIWHTPDPIEQTRIISEKEIYPIKLKLAGAVVPNNPKIDIFINGRKQENGKLGDTKINIQNIYAKIKLQEGENRIQVFVGKTKSKTITIHYSSRKPNLHILAIGPDYKDSHNTSSLEYTDDDVREFIKRYEKKQGQIFEKIFKEILIGSEATSYNIYEKIRNLKFKTIGEKDVLILYISSHGEYDKVEKKFYLRPNNYQKGNPAAIVDYSVVTNALANISCKKIIFIDACFSGGAKSDIDPEAINDVIRELSQKQNFMITMTSSKDNQLSYENEVWKHGAFSKAILEGLDGAADKEDELGRKDRIITIDELYEYIRERVPQMVRKELGKLQNPNIYKNNINEDIPIYVY